MTKRISRNFTDMLFVCYSLCMRSLDFRRAKMISANIKRVQIALLLILIALPTVAQVPFAALFSDRVTLDGTPLNGAYDPKMSTEIIEGMGTCHFIDNDVIPSNKITALCEDKDGNIFIGTKDAGVIRFSAISSRRDVFNSFRV